MLDLPAVDVLLSLRLAHQRLGAGEGSARSVGLSRTIAVFLCFGAEHGFTVYSVSASLGCVGGFVAKDV